MSEFHFEEISLKLDQIVRLLALSATADRSRDDQLLFLSKAGFQPKAIAEIIGTTSNSVRVRLSQLRKKSKGGKKSG